MVLTITPEECMRMKRILLDEDTADALALIRELCKRLERQKQQGLKSHLDAQ